MADAVTNLLDLLFTLATIARGLLPDEELDILLLLDMIYS